MLMFGYITAMLLKSARAVSVSVYALGQTPALFIPATFHTSTATSASSCMSPSCNLALLCSHASSSLLRCGYVSNAFPSVIFCDTLVRYTGSACASSRCPYSRNHLLAVLGFSFRRFSCSASCGAACSPQLKRSLPRLQVCSYIRGRIAVGLNASL